MGLFHPTWNPLIRTKNLNIRVITFVNKESFLFDEIADGNSINVERIAPKATNKCNHRTDVNDGRVHKRL
jgi:hypothetical protein